jgi:tryptophanyl-tRNA synthetase
MSKSYNNTIPLWLDEAALRKAIMGILTNSQAPGEAKNPDDSHIFTLFQAFASAEEIAAMRKAFADGIAWGEAKQRLFDQIDRELAPARARYNELIANPAEVEQTLLRGAERARERTRDVIRALRHAVGLRALTSGAGAPVASGAADAADAKPIVIKNYREKDGRFYFKIHSGDGDLLVQSAGFDSPKASGLLIAAFKAADPDSLRAIDGAASFAEGEVLGAMSADLLEQLRAGLRSLQIEQSREKQA